MPKWKQDAATYNTDLVFSWATPPRNITFSERTAAKTPLMNSGGQGALRLGLRLTHVAHANRNCGPGIPVSLLQMKLRAQVPVVEIPLDSQHVEARDSVYPIKQCPSRTFEFIHAPHVLIVEEVEDELRARLHGSFASRSPPPQVQRQPLTQLRQ